MISRIESGMCRYAARRWRVRADSEKTVGAIGVVGAASRRGGHAAIRCHSEVVRGIYADLSEYLGGDTSRASGAAVE